MKKDIIKEVSNEIIHTVDAETGEVIDTSVKKVKILVNEEEFALIYAGFWNTILNSGLSSSDIELLAYLISNYSDGTPFVVNSAVRKEIANKTEKSETSYKNSTRKLFQAKFIYDVGFRTYKVNPRFAYKGSSNSRKKAVIEMVETCKNC
jgi:predicted transcriptional regulator